MDDHFKNLKIVFDTTFCGDWAGNTWNESSCASLAPTCEEYVAKNPQAFKDSYWAVNTLQVFQDDGTAGPVNVTVPVGKNAPQTQANTGVGKFIHAAHNLSDKVKEKWVQAQSHRRRSRPGGSTLPR